MTRINLGIAPRELCDQHLIAEYRELPRAWQYIRRGVGHIPGPFRLGRGHVLWCAQFPGTLGLRFEALVQEMQARGFNPLYVRTPGDIDGSFLPIPQILAARAITIPRLQERLVRMRPPPRWTRRKPPAWAWVSLRKEYQ